MKRISLFLTAFILSLNVYSQGDKLHCSSPEMNKRAMLENPDAAAAKEKLDNFTQQFSNQAKQVYVIPVVFHVVHNYGSENISKAQIEDCIRVFNNDFRKRNSDTSITIPEFQGIAADCMIELRLAKIDPDGNCTDGIERIVSQTTYNANEDTKDAAPAWPRDKYLNVWTVASIESGAAGYSYYPSSVDGSWGAGRDGVLLLHNYVGSIGTSSVLTSRTLTHEVGHYLNLMHTWGNSNEPGLAENCNDDDDVFDTPNTIGHTSCDLYANTCGSLDNIQNYMEYTYCNTMFTAGQRDRMHATLNNTVADRNNLWTEQNLIATGTNNGYTAAPCIPVSDFKGAPLNGCAGFSVEFKDMSWNSDSITIREWSFPGGNPASSTIVEPLVEYANPGKFDVTLVTGNNSGTDTLTLSDFVNVIDVNYGLGIPVNESFESATFPTNSDELLSWKITKEGSAGWARVVNAAYDGTASLSVFNPANSAGDESELISPNILTDTLGANAEVKFRLAYAMRNSTSTDMLRVWVSYDCGETWKIRYSRSGASLATNGGAYVSSFTPTLSQWREETVSLGAFSAYPNILLKFVCISGDGNKIYIDKIGFGNTTEINSNDFNAIYKPELYPNPGEGPATLEWFSPSPEKVSVEISDLSGRLLYSMSKEAEEGYNNMSIDRASLSQGIYLIRIKTANGEGIIRMGR